MFISFEFQMCSTAHCRRVAMKDWRCCKLPKDLREEINGKPETFIQTDPNRNWTSSIEMHKKWCEEGERERTNKKLWFQTIPISIFLTQKLVRKLYSKPLLEVNMYGRRKTDGRSNLSSMMLSAVWIHKQNAHRFNRGMNGGKIAFNCGIGASK